MGYFYSIHSVFDNKVIPYPKREFLHDDDNDDKTDKHKVCRETITNKF